VHWLAVRGARWASRHSHHTILFSRASRDLTSFFRIRKSAHENSLQLRPAPGTSVVRCAQIWKTRARNIRRLLRQYSSAADIAPLARHSPLPSPVSFLPSPPGRGAGGEGGHPPALFCATPRAPSFTTEAATGARRKLPCVLVPAAPLGAPRRFGRVPQIQNQPGPLRLSKWTAVLLGSNSSAKPPSRRLSLRPRTANRSWESSHWRMSAS